MCTTPFIPPRSRPPERGAPAREHPRETSPPPQRAARGRLSHEPETASPLIPEGPRVVIAFAAGPRYFGQAIHHVGREPDLVATRVEHHAKEILEQVRLSRWACRAIQGSGAEAVALLVDEEARPCAETKARLHAIARRAAELYNLPLVEVRRSDVVRLLDLEASSDAAICRQLVK